jgi:hypothetical protein
MWFFEHFRRYPALRFRERIAMARKPIEEGGLGIGKTAAEDAYARAMELQREHCAEIVKGYREHVIRASMEDEEEARRIKDYRAANRIRMDLAKLLGLNEPEKIELTGSVNVEQSYDFSDVPDEVLAMVAGPRAIAAAAARELPVPVDKPVEEPHVADELSRGDEELVAEPSHGADELEASPPTSEPDPAG